MIRLANCALFLSAVFLAPLCQAGEWTVQESDGGAVVKHDGKFVTEYLTDSGPKPVLWPVIGPGGHEFTRAYPMRDVEGERKDHPHQRSIWFTHGDVNGTDFWTEAAGHGTIKHEKFLKLEGGDEAVISALCSWIDKDGKKIGEDTRTYTIFETKTGLGIDFDITFKAMGEVTFGDTKEGSVGVRVPTVLDVDRKMGGKIVNSEGQTDKAAWGKRASWVDYHGKIGGDEVGVAILNHPSSFRYPTYWHVRTYGLFAANPFGEHHFQGKKEHTGEHTLKDGETLTLRHRILLHSGDEKSADIAGEFEKYSKEEK